MDKIILCSLKRDAEFIKLLDFLKLLGCISLACISLGGFYTQLAKRSMIHHAWVFIIAPSATYICR